MKNDLYGVKKHRIKYHLYLMSLDRENFSFAVDERFSRITPLYILVYTQKKLKGFSEITNDNAVLELSKADLDWLDGCNLCIMREILRKNVNMLKEAQERFIADLGKQLELVMQEEYSDGREESERK